MQIIVYSINQMTTLLLILAVSLSRAAITRKMVEVKDVALMYSDNGEILQMAYAQKAISKSTSLIGFTMNNIAFVLSRIPIRNKLTIYNPAINYRHINIGKTCGVFTGLSSDVKFVLRHANSLAQSHQMTYGEVIPQMQLASELSKFLTLCIHPRSYFAFHTIVCLYYITPVYFSLHSDDKNDERIGRPLACSGILIGPSDILKENIRQVSLIACEHTGFFKEVNFCVFGKLSEFDVQALKLLHSEGKLNELLELSGKLLLEEREAENDSFGHLELTLLEAGVSSEVRHLRIDATSLKTFLLQMSTLGLISLDKNP